MLKFNIKLLSINYVKKNTKDHVAKKDCTLYWISLKKLCQAF